MAVMNGGSPNNLEFYSAPSSPAIGNELSPRFDDDFDFEFETSKKFRDSMEFDDGNIECFLEVERKPKVIRARGGGSLPTTMSFADELFFNGLVMPLKPPPRLQVQVQKGGVSVPSSPTSSGFKNPFVRRVAWNDDFDPFIVALQKVSEENRGRRSSSGSSTAAGSNHRRTRSHSPFRTNHSETEHHHHRCSNNNNSSSGRSSHFNNMPQEQLKGSPYARWVLNQKSNQVVNPHPKGKNMLKGFTFVKSRIRPVKTTDIFGEKKGHQENGETKMKRIKGFLQKYASFRKGNGEDKSTNQNSTRRGTSSYSYLKKLSFKMKGNSAAAATDENRKKRVAIMEMEEPKLAVVEYKRNKPLYPFVSTELKVQENKSTNN